MLLAMSYSFDCSWVRITVDTAPVETIAIVASIAIIVHSIVRLIAR
jgi:hypothetical protein